MKYLLLVTMLLSSMFAKDIDIKGLKIGMTFEEANKIVKFNKGQRFSFAINPTFGGVKAEYLAIELKNNKISNIAVNLKSDDFDNVIGALLDKYDLKCKDSLVQTKIGAKYNQVKCSYSSNGVNLIVEKYSGNVSESLIMVLVPPTEEEIKKENEKVKNDI